MADNVMESNLSSPYVLKNTAKNEVELVSYGHRKNTGISVMKYQKLANSLDGAAANTPLRGYTCDMEVGKAGRLRIVPIKVPFTVTAGSTITTPTVSSMSGLGKRLGNVILSTPEHELFKQTIYSFPALFARLRYEQKVWVNKITQVFDAATGMPLTSTNEVLVSGTPYYTYIPVLGPFMHGDRLNWDLQKLESIRVYLTISSSDAEMGFGASTTATITAGSKVEIFPEYITYEPDYKQALYLSNFGAPPAPGDPSKWMTYTSYTTSSQKFTIPASGATTGTTIRIPFRSPCANFTLFMPKITANTTVVCGRQANKKILSVKLIPDSFSYIENVDPGALCMGLESQNGPNIEMIAGGINRVAIDENVVDIGFCTRANDLTSFSGCLAYNGIKDMSIALTYDTITATDYAIVYGQVQYSELLMNGMDGDFSSTVSG